MTGVCLGKDDFSFGLVRGIVRVQERCWRVPKMEVVSDSRLGGSSGQFFTENVAA